MHRNSGISGSGQNFATFWTFGLNQNSGSKFQLYRIEWSHLGKEVHLNRHHQVYNVHTSDRHRPSWQDGWTISGSLFNWSGTEVAEVISTKYTSVLSVPSIHQWHCIFVNWSLRDRNGRWIIFEIWVRYRIDIWSGNQNYHFFPWQISLLRCPCSPKYQCIQSLANIIAFVSSSFRKCPIQCLLSFFGRGSLFFCFSAFTCPLRLLDCTPDPQKLDASPMLTFSLLTSCSSFGLHLLRKSCQL